MRRGLEGWFKAEGITHAKALGQVRAWHVEGIERRPAWLEQNEGVRRGRGRR